MTKPVFAAASGLVEAIDTRAIGVAVVELGGGRAKAADTIDHAVGFTELVGSGDDIGPHRPLGLVHAASEAAADRAAAALRRAYMIGTEAPAMRAAIALRIGT